jgi:AraC-like DNA-binding protein
VDALSNLLTDVRAHGALFDQTIVQPPWSVRFADNAPLTVVVMLSGVAWVHSDAAPLTRLDPGAVAVVVGGTPFTLADAHDPPAPPQAVVHGPDRVTGLDGSDRRRELRIGVRTCGERDDGATVVLTGSYQIRGVVSDRLLAALPPVLVVPDEGEMCPLMDITLAEVGRHRPGQQAVLDRLLDLLLLTTLREWLDRPEATPPAWYRALGDPEIGTALRLLHEEPERRWTIAGLAAEVGISRASLARRFADLVGEPPMTYLTNWRLSLAADLLQRTRLSVDAIARRVGYHSGYALSVAFKRVHGIRPSEYRNHQTTAAA